MSKEPFIDPAMFSKPPPNFKDSVQKFNSFRVPSYPSTITCGYNESPPSRYCTREPPPNFSSRSLQKPQFPISIEKNRNDMMFNPINMVQPFKPDVPPPPFNKNVSSQSSILTGNLDEDKSNYYLMMVYRFQNSANTSQLSPSSNSYPASSLSKTFSLPPPLTHIPPPQPPLPPLPPPQTPPPPPPPSASRSTSTPMQKHQMGNYHNRISPYSLYGSNYTKMYSFKRKFEGNEIHKKLQKKKKKPLSQVVPQRRDWTLGEAKRALDVEKECNKRSKRQGLIIKFPDLELNRDIVSNFHTSIESVHFQQPSTPRYCFVTLTESADPETVISQLNQIPFGLGYLSAEIKKDREDELNIKPSDIDPLTLYVGNLAQDITKDDMTKAYPKQKRIDIGYAKKMKYTRYAFVSFYTVDDAIEAFQSTHSSQMHSKSLIVRFRRLHGTVGMPGEPKQQISQRTEIENNNFNILETCKNNLNEDNESNKVHNPWDIDISHWENDYEEEKSSRMESFTSEDDEEEETEIKPSPNIRPITRFKPGSLEVAFSLHKPKVIQIKEEKENSTYQDDAKECNSLQEDRENVPVAKCSNSENFTSNNENSNLAGEKEIEDVATKIKCEKDTINSPSSSKTSYNFLRNLNQQVRTGNFSVNLNKPSNVVYIKKEQENNSVALDTISNNDRCGDYEQNSSNGVINVNNSNELSTRNSNLQNSTSFDWMNEDYSTYIKTENSEDDQVHDGDDDASDDDLSMENILNRARNRSKMSNS